MLPEFIPEQPLTDLIQNAREDIVCWDLYYDSCGGSILTNLSESQLFQLRHNPDATLEFLRSTDISLRMAALYLVYDYWISHPHFASHCLHLAFHDVVQEVRGLALCCLPRMYEFIHDSHGHLRHLLKTVHGDFTMKFEGSLETCTPIVESARRQVEEMNREDWLQNAGPHLDDMMTSVQRTEGYLEHSNEQLRYVALSLLTNYWQPTPKAAVVALGIAKGASLNRDLKCAALELLGRYYRKSNDPEIGSLLALIVTNESEDRIVRRTAYLLLYCLRGIPTTGLPEPATISSFPDKVDWGFVQSFLARSE